MAMLLRLKIRSMVGLLPLFATTVFEPGTLARYPRLMELIELFRKRHPEVMRKIATADDPSLGGYGGRRLMAVCNKEKLQRILAYLLDENEFFSPYGIRSLSKYHLEHPFLFYLGGHEYKVQYLPAESNNILGPADPAKGRPRLYSLAGEGPGLPVALAFAFLLA
jgi:hypothetical protein